MINFPIAISHCQKIPIQKHQKHPQRPRLSTGFAMADRFPSEVMCMVRHSVDIKFSRQAAVEGASAASVSCQEPHSPPRAEASRGVKYLRILDS